MISKVWQKKIAFFDIFFEYRYIKIATVRKFTKKK
jgi:hypothetical protein